MILNCVLSLMLLILNTLPYYLPWFIEPSTVPIDAFQPFNDTYKPIYITLLKVAVPQPLDQPAIKTSFPDYTSQSCPTLDMS